MSSAHRYFTIMHGLRGCYMSDSDSFVCMVKTRRELKELIQGEVDGIHSGQTLGFSKRKIASFVADCWAEAGKKNPAYLPYCLPCKEPGQSSYSYGVFCSVSSRHEYLQHIKSAEG